MSKRDAQELLHRSSLQLVEEGTVLAAADDQPSDSSLVHIIIAGKAASTRALGVCPAPDASAPQPAAQRMGYNLVRELDPGVAAGFASLALQRPNRAAVHCVSPCLVLTTECGTVRKACEAPQGQEHFALLREASKEAARHEDVLTALARSSLQTMSDIQLHLASLLSSLSALDGFRMALSGEGQGHLPPRNLAALFTSAPKLLQIASEMRDVLSGLLVDNSPTGGSDQTEAGGGGGVISYKMEDTLSLVLKLLGSMARNGMSPLASGALRSMAELTWMQANAAVSASIQGQEQTCGKLLVDLLCEPMCVWPRVAKAGEALVREVEQSLEALGASSRKVDWLGKALTQDGVDSLAETAQLCADAWQDVGGYLDTLHHVDSILPSTNLCAADCDVSGSQDRSERAAADIGMQRIAPIPGSIYTRPESGTHHRVMHLVSGELLPAAARVNDVCAGLAAGRPCQIMMLNDLLAVTVGGHFEEGHDGIPGARSEGGGLQRMTALGDAEGMRKMLV